MFMPNDTLLSMRLPADLVARLDALAEALQQDDRLRAVSGGKVSRSAALRLAMVEGIDVLEEKYNQGAKR